MFEQWQSRQGCNRINPARAEQDKTGIPLSSQLEHVERANKVVFE
jgi:hypothetical protein